MKIAFILDPLDKLKAYKDSSIAMMRAAAGRGHQVFAIQREALVWDGGTVSARAHALTPTDDNNAWYVPGTEEVLPLTTFDAVLIVDAGQVVVEIGAAATTDRRGAAVIDIVPLGIERCRAFGWQHVR